MRHIAVIAAACAVWGWSSAVHAQQVSGQVVDGRNAPVSGARISFDPGGKTATTKPNGEFTVDGLADGAYRASVSVGQRSPQTFSVTVAGGRLDPAVLPLASPEHTVRGLVRDRDGMPLARASVAFSGAKAGMTSTDADGAFEFTGPEGEYSVTIRSGAKTETLPRVVIQSGELKPSTLTVSWVP